MIWVKLLIHLSGAGGTIGPYYYRFREKLSDKEIDSNMQEIFFAIRDKSIYQDVEYMRPEWEVIPKPPAEWIIDELEKINDARISMMAYERELRELLS